jgi:hypothetical protein
MSPRKDLDVRSSRITRRLQRPDPNAKVVQQPGPGEALVQGLLTPLVEALAHPDESCRRAAFEHVLRTCLPAVVGRLIERLVGLLDGAGTTQRQAGASLAQFGGRAVPALTLRFTRTRSVALQRGIVEALTRMAPALKQEERIDLLTEVLTLARFATDASVRRNLTGLVVVARQAIEAGSRTN